MVQSCYARAVRLVRVTSGAAAALAAIAVMLSAAPTHAAAPAFLWPSHPLDPPIQLIQPWPTYAGSLGTSLVAFPAVAGRPMTLALTEVEAFIPRFQLFQHQAGRGTYAWVACNSQAYFTPDANLNSSDCVIAADPPEGRVAIVDGKIAPVDPSDWRPLVNNDLFGVSSVHRVSSWSTGLFVGLKFVAEGLDNGVVTARTYGSSTSALVLPYNTAPTVRPVLLTAPPTAGLVVRARRAEWSEAPPYMVPFQSTDVMFVCERAAAAADTRVTWAQENGCRQLDDVTAGDALRIAPMQSRLAAGDAGKFFLIQSTLYGRGIANSVPGVTTWTHRTPAVRIVAPDASPANQADPADGGGAAADPSAGGDGAQSPAPQAGGGDAAAASGSDAAAAIGAGVDLATAPLADANGQGVGPAAGLTMQVAASSRVNRGRRITVKAVVTPKTSQGLVRMTLVRFNSKGKAIRGAVFTKPLKRGEAIRRWRVAKSYQPGAFTLVVTYVPKQAGAPGITRTLPVRVG